MQISMKDKDGLWIKKGHLPKLLKFYLFDLGQPEDYTTKEIDEAQDFNWFMFGFFDYIFKSYNIYTREAFIETPSLGRRWYHALIR